MAEYIERKALKEVYKRYLNAPHVQISHYVGQAMRIAIKGCIDLLDNERVADVVEVVRCRKCVSSKNCYPMKLIDKEPIEAWFCERNRKYVRPDDFCSYGERRTK